jgi:hypothetical protein
LRRREGEKERRREGEKERRREGEKERRREGEKERRGEGRRVLRLRASGTERKGASCIGVRSVRSARASSDATAMSHNMPNPRRTGRLGRPATVRSRTGGTYSSSRKQIGSHHRHTAHVKRRQMCL